MVWISSFPTGSRQDPASRRLLVGWKRVGGGGGSSSAVLKSERHDAPLAGGGLHGVAAQDFGRGDGEAAEVGGLGGGRLDEMAEGVAVELGGAAGGGAPGGGVEGCWGRMHGASVAWMRHNQNNLKLGEFIGEVPLLQGVTRALHA